MNSLPVLGIPCLPMIALLGGDPGGRGQSQISGGLVLGEQVRPEDAQGLAVVTFSGVNADSEIRVYSQVDGAELAGVESCAASQVLTWPYYAVGSPNNGVVIRIVAWLFKIKEFTYTTTPGSTSIPVQQERDKWALNP